MKKKFCKILAFFYAIFLISLTANVLSKELPNDKIIEIGNQNSINESVTTEVDDDTDPKQNDKVSNVSIEGYIGAIKDPTVDYISVTVPTTGFFQIVTNPPASYGGKAVWVTPIYFIKNDGPNPIRVTLDDISPHNNETPKDIELNPNAAKEDQAGNRTTQPKAELAMVLSTLQNWINSNRTPKPLEENPISLRTIGGNFLDGLIQPPGIVTPLDGYRLGYIQGASSQPAAELRTAYYKLNMIHDTLPSADYNPEIKTTDFKFKFTIRAVVLSSESEQ